jgi:hypothetical protein
VQNLVEERRKLIDEKAEQINRLTSPLADLLSSDAGLVWLDREAAYALLERWPTLPEWQRVSAAKLRMFFRKHHCRDQEVIERRIVGIRQAVPAIQDRAVIEAKSAVVKVMAQLIRTLLTPLSSCSSGCRTRMPGAVTDSGTLISTFISFAPERAGWRYRRFLDSWLSSRVAKRARIAVSYLSDSELRSYYF